MLRNGCSRWAKYAESVNNRVDEPLDKGKLRRVLAQVEVSYSNSMIEAWWRCLKHSRLYLHSLDSAAAVERLVGSYVEQHNTVMPHRAFDGRTPDEVYFGVGANLAGELAERRRLAREQRVASNRSLTCAACGSRDAAAGAVPREAAQILLVAIASRNAWEVESRSSAYTTGSESLRDTTNPSTNAVVHSGGWPACT